MGERYWISGVQLTLLTQCELPHKQLQEIFNEVYDKQFIGNEKEFKKKFKKVKK